MRPTPLLVTVPFRQIPQRIMDMSGAFQAPKVEGDQSGDFPIGCLSGYRIAGLSDKEAAERDLGREIGYLVMVPVCEAGYIDVLSCWAIRCETIEEAMALPGFAPMFMHSGKQKEIA